MCALELVVQEEISDYLPTVPSPLFAVSKETFMPECECAHEISALDIHTAHTWPMVAVSCTYQWTHPC